MPITLTTMIMRAMITAILMDTATLILTATSTTASHGHVGMATIPSDTLMRIGDVEVCEVCGHSHAPDPAMLGGDRFDWRTAWSAVAAVGIRPARGR